MIVGLALATLPSGCDQGKQNDASLGVGPPVHLVATNLGASTLPINGRIELSFDRLLLPLSTVRQTFVLLDSQNNSVDPVPTVAYDPVSRVVTVTPDPTSLDVGQNYKLVITTPSSATDENGLRAVDGAYLSADSPSVLDFTVTAALSAPATETPTIDFCRDIAPVISDPGRCTTCHSPNLVAGGTSLAFAGLALDTPADIQSTAILQVAHGSNNGPMAAPQQPLLQFTEDVPIIDPGRLGTGDPGHSWLIYKLLMAPPPACEAKRSLGYPLCDGGAPFADAATQPASIAGLYQVSCSDAGDPCPQALSDDERARLASLIPGREMPYPNDPAAALTANTLALTVPELELVSLWIAQGAPLPASCP